ncbi:MAG: HEAT repeat domain-containing protein [Candidatus Dormibacteraeota bacterium]|nr:HEAT repeat domain-containing protein [Candidatus Dormibacteraeota bacterium]
MSDFESGRSIKRSGRARATASRSRLGVRVDRVLSAAIAGEPHVALNVKVSELLADDTVASTIRSFLERSGPGIMAHWRVLQALQATGLDSDLLNSLVDPDPKVRIAAARLCGAFRLTDSVPWLADLMGDTNPKVRDAAVRALGSLGGRRAVDALMAAVDRLPQHRLAIELSHAASDMDMELLMREPASVQAAVVTVLACGLRYDALRVGALTGIAHDRRWPSRVRSAACCALAMIGEPSTADGLRRLTGDPEAGVRFAAAKARRRFHPAPTAGSA